MKYSLSIIVIIIILFTFSLGSVSFAFVGPGSLTPGTGNGALQVDSNLNIGFGTNLATPTGDATNAVFGRVFTIASTSDPGISLRNLGGGRNYTMYSRANGRFVIWDDFSSRPRFFIDANGFVGISGNSTSTYFFTPASALHVAGSIQSDAAFVGAVAPSSITGGAFQATNYAFPSAIGIGTTTVSGLPTNGLYVKGGIGIGTMGPARELHINSSDGSQIYLQGTTGSWDGIQFQSTSYDSYFGQLEGDGRFFIDTDSNGDDLVVLQNGNVGIGTTAPSNKLTVGVADNSTVQASGGAVLNIFNSDSTVNNYSSIAFGQSGASSNSFSRIGVQYKDRTGSSEDQDIFFSTIGAGAYAERMRILSTGNVGIGTAAPGYKLTVNSTNNVNGLFVSAGDASPYDAKIARFRYVGNSNDIVIENFAGKASIQARFANENAMDLLLQGSGGNVGVGTGTPGSKLTVAGVIESTTGGIKFPDGTMQVTAGGGTGTSVGWSRTGTNVYLSTSTDWVGIGTSTPTQALDVRGNIYVSGNITTGGTMTTNVGASNVSAGSFGTTAGKGNYRFEGAATTNDVLKIDATNERVGVGTASPGAKLEISSATGGVGSGSGVIIRGVGTGAQSWEITPSASQTLMINRPGLRLMGVGNDGSFWGGGVGGDSPNLNDAKFNFAASGNSWINGGNVGIGTTGPISKMHIAGNGSDMFSLTSMGGIHLANGYNDGTWGVRLAGVDNGSNGHDLQIQTRSTNNGAFSNSVTVKSGGNVGVGATTPRGKFEVRQSAGAYPIIVSSADWAHGITDTAPTDEALQYELHGSGGNLLRFFSSGADFSPVTFYGIHGNISPTSAAMAFNASKRSGTSQIALTASEKAFRFDNWGTNLLMVLGNGYVGIGTSTPTNALDVVGNIRATGNIISGGTMTANVGAGNVSAGTFGTTAGKGNYTFEAAANTNNVLKVDATNERVGIGTGSPATKLEVRSSTTTLTISDEANNYNIGDVQNTLYFNGRWWSGQTNPSADAYGDAAIRTLKEQGDGTGGVGLAFLTSGTGGAGISERLRISRDGNIGIGVTAPTYHLESRGGAAGGNVMFIEGNNQVNGTGVRLVFSGNSYNGILSVAAATVGTGGSAGINFDSYTTNRDASIFVDESDSQKLKINVNKSTDINAVGGGTNAVTIDTSANVGIGTSTPVSRFSVQESRSVSTNAYGSMLSFTPGYTLNNLETAAIYAKNSFSGGANPYHSGIIGESYFTGNYGNNYLAGVLGRSIYENNSAGLYMTGTQLIGLKGEVTAQGTGNSTIPSSFGLYTSGSVVSGSTMTNYYDAYFAGVSGAGTVTNRWGLYQASASAKNFFAGNIGIGTTTPTNALDVVGNIRATGNIIAGGTMTANVGAPNVSAGTFGTTAGKGNYTFEAAANTNNVLKVDATNERVGIGTGSPTQKLEVRGVSIFSSSISNVAIGAYSDDLSGLFSTITSNNHGDFVFGSNLKILTDHTLTTTNNHSSITGGAIVIGGNGYTNGENSINFFAKTPGAATAGTIVSPSTAAMVIRGGGNIGIGNTNPSFKLDFAIPESVNDTSSIRFGIQNGPVGGGGTAVGGGVVWKPNYTGYTKRSAGILQTAESNYFQSGLAFYTNGTADATTDWSERMRITSGGNVGIGTTGPLSKLDINGNTNGTGFRFKPKTTTTPGGGNRVLQFEQESDWGTQYYIKQVTNAGVVSNDVKLNFFPDNSNANPMMTLDANTSNVGIASTTPAYKLAVIGTGYFANPVVVGSPTDASHATTKSYVDSLVTGGATSGNLATLIVTGTTTLASTGGKVIIGGAGPSLKLDVTGQGQFTDTMSATKYYDYNDTAYYLDPANTGTALKLAGSLESGGSGTSYVLGNTLIGVSTNPGSYKFAVSGTSYFNNQVTIAANLLMGASQNITLQSGNITGVNKITAAVIDPLYEIDGEKYATYGSDTVGVKTEMFAKASLLPISNFKFQISNKDAGEYAYIIDFAHAERGSDLWVFWQTIKEGNDMKDITLTLTPEGKPAELWYELNPKEKQVVVYGDAPVTFSYHLVAPRHDAETWTTKRGKTEEKASFILKSK